MKCGASGIVVGTSRLNLLSCNSFSSSPMVSLFVSSALHKQRCSNKREDFCFVPLFFNPFCLPGKERAVFIFWKEVKLSHEPKRQDSAGLQNKNCPG